VRRGVIIADLHAGHVVGLTHPDFNPRFSPGSPFYELMRERTKYWNWYAETIASLQPIDFLFVNGDAIDGKGEASGGTELLTTDRNEQVNMAVAAIEECKAKNIWMAYGTGYHSGREEDWEVKIAEKVGAIKIGGEDYIDVNGLIFSCKHHLGRSESPMGRFTALARDRVWNVLWNEFSEYPRADVIVRAHVHYHSYCGGYGWLGVTCPSLMGYGSKYGTRRMSGSVDFGLLEFNVESKEKFSWQAHILKSNSQKSMLLTI